MKKNFWENVVDEIESWKEFFVDEFTNPNLIQRILFILLFILSVIIVVAGVLAIVGLIMHPEALKDTDTSEMFLRYYVIKNNVLH